MTSLLVAFGAAIGAPVRYLLDRAVLSLWRDSVFPWGTLLVNVLASGLLGFLVAALTDPFLRAVLGTGFCGALSTYSTFGHQTLLLLTRRTWLLAVLNVGANLLAGLGAACCGVALARVVG